MISKPTLLFFGIALRLLSLGCCVPNPAVDTKVALAKMNSKRQATDNDTCVENAVNSGAVSSDCIIAILTAGATDNSTNFISLNFNATCTPVCNSLYAVAVKCFGAAQAQNKYATLCPNGYRGAGSQLNFNYAILLVSALVAVLFRIVA